MANKEVNSNKRGYTILENDVLDNPNLNMQEQSLLIALISYHHKEKGYAYPNYEQLKLRSKIKDNRTLSKNINSLIEKKFIKKETIKGRGCKYYINLPSGELHHVENSTTCKNTLPPSGKLHYDLVENS
ncbi:helix-turn-helix domain-containing protein, partial [Clostridium perfringens]